MFEGFVRERIETAGTTINVVRGGAGPPLLLLHGYPQTHVEWHKVAPIFAEHYTVVAPDLRGYGDSGKPPSDGGLVAYCKRTTANDQVEVMSKLGFDAFHVVGHDRGVRVGHRMALDHPERVRTLTSLDVVASQAAFDNMDASLSFAWFHWHLMRQPSPLPETLIGNSVKVYLDFLLGQWTAVEGAITDEAYAEYLRCFDNPDNYPGELHGLPVDRAGPRARRRGQGPEAGDSHARTVGGQHGETARLADGGQAGYAHDVAGARPRRAGTRDRLRALPARGGP